MSDNSVNRLIRRLIGRVALYHDPTFPVVRFGAGGDEISGSSTASIRRWKSSMDESLVKTKSMSSARLSPSSICRMAFSSGPRSPSASRARMRLAAISTGQTTRKVVTLAPELFAITRKRLRCSSHLNEPTAMTSLFVVRASRTAAPMAEYACAMASLVRSPEALRAAAPNCSAKVSDANLTAPHRSAARNANVDFPEPGTPETIRRRRPSTTLMPLLYGPRWRAAPAVCRQSFGERWRSLG